MTLAQYLEFKIGDRIAWELLDGNTMAGTITDKGFDTFSVTRVDGSPCRLNAHASNARKASPVEVLAACRFFERSSHAPTR